MINLDIKPEVSHLEDTKTDIDLVKAPILKSDLDTLTAWQTVKRFWKAIILCNLLCIAAAADGYQSGPTGP